MLLGNVLYTMLGGKKAEVNRWVAEDILQKYVTGMRK